MGIFRKKNEAVPDESPLVRRRGVWFRGAACFGGGLLYAAALPPLNWSWAAFVMLTPLIWCATERCRWRLAGFYGWLWGLGWSLFAFRFLREINPAVPWLLAPVISLWPAVWAALLPGLWRITIYPDGVENGGEAARRNYLASGAQPWRLAVFGLGAAALFTLLEWTRSRLFVWNDFSVTQYRNLPLLQIAEFTGGYGVNFLVALGNSAIFALAFRRARVAAAVLALLPAAAAGYGWYRLGTEAPLPERTVTALAVQGDLSQRRHASLERAAEALEIYRSLTGAALAEAVDFDFIVWPESAVPLPFFSSGRLNRRPALSPYGRLCRDYQDTVYGLAARSGRPFLLGTLDFEEVLPVRGIEPGATNSVLLINPDGTLGGRYDKMHRVPFGEYVPFRRFLPGWLVNYIDMGRDLTPGSNPRPLEPVPGVRIGVAVCYEGVFSYQVRKLARHGANLLLAVSNDAWYPRSSEPEQHLANAVLRAVETGLPMIRVGNNGGTGVVLPTGRFTQCPVTPGGERRPELGRGRAVVRLRAPVVEKVTFYVRCGEWFIGVLGGGTAVWLGWTAAVILRRRRRQLELNRPGNPGSAPAGGAEL